MDFTTDFRMLINGGLVAGAGVPVVNPATELVVGEAPDCSREQLDNAVSAARNAFVSWRATSFETRQAALVAIADALEGAKEGLASILISEHGKSQRDAAEDILSGVYFLRSLARMDLPVEVIEDSEKRRIEVRRVPLGVVAAITPWNFPIASAALKLGGALLTGNTVVLKPSSYTPLATLKLGELVKDIIPPGALNIITGGAGLGSWLTTHRGVDKISFTGSTETGRRIMEAAAATLKRITLELGGNDAAIVFPDVDVPSVAKQIFRGSFANSGQICIATKRVYVHEAIYEEFAREFSDLANAARIGDGTDPASQFGPVQNRPQYQLVCGLIAESQKAGHAFLAGGTIPEGAGFFLPLSVVDNPPQSSRVVQEEQFGPILPLLRFTDIDEVVSWANDSEYGLGAQIWTANEEAALELAGRLETGNVWINQAAAMYPNAPFGGHKASGIGVELGRDGLVAFTNAQTVAVNRRKAH